MEIHHSKSTIVIVGELHNPTIINQDFLAMQDIVPIKWQWEVKERIFVTPALSRIQYTNDVVIHVEPNRAQFTDPRENPPTESELPYIASKFVETLQHVRYKALGINFFSFAFDENPEHFLKDRFIKTGEWETKPIKLHSVGQKLVYLIPNGIATLYLDAGAASKTVDNSEETLPAVIINCNFHYDCKEYPADKSIISFIEEISMDWQLYQDMLKNTIQLR